MTAKKDNNPVVNISTESAKKISEELLQKYIEVLNDNTQSWAEKTLRKFPFLKKFFLQQDAVKFYTIQLITLTYSMISTTNLQQDRLDLISRILTASLRATSPTDLPDTSEKKLSDQSLTDS